MNETNQKTTEKMAGLDSKYLRLLKSKGITPNFWCSDEYFQKAKFVEMLYQSVPFKGGKYVAVKDGSHQMMFPPASLEYGRVWADEVVDEDIWSDFTGYNPMKGVKTFLDYEFIYDPKAFMNMKGGKWSTFRKNSRKYPREHFDLEYRNVKTGMGDADALQRFLKKWLDNISWNDIEDGITMTEYFFHGKNRAVLIDREGVIHGLNIWDENYKFINYRYCICHNRPYLSEYMRLLFMLDMSNQPKLINDGGCLGDDALERFKRKLNPLYARPVFIWKV